MRVEVWVLFLSCFFFFFFQAEDGIRDRTVTGVQTCALPICRIHRLALVRGVNTAEDEHNRGAALVLTGRRPEPAVEFPHVGAVMAKLLAGDGQALPGHMHITPSGGSGFGKQDATFLGPTVASVSLG